MLRLLALACLSSLAAALTPASAPRAPISRSPRTAAPVAQQWATDQGYQQQGYPQQQGGYPDQQGYQQQEYQQQGQGYAAAPAPFDNQPQGLPFGWVSGVDEASGMTYYYNEQTGQSQWEPPPGAAAGAGAAGYGGGQFAAAGTWQVCNAAGTCFVVRPGEDHIIGRNDLPVPKNTISRSQCQIQVSADGTAKVMSCGKPETGYASGGRPWEFLRCYESRQLQNGDLISLDKNDLESAMFTCYVS